MQDNQPLHVYVVDDDPDHVMIIQLVLQGAEQPTTVETIGDGAAALDALQSAQVQPDLILLDINMPGLSGLDVLARIKNDAHLQRIPVVMLTSSTLQADIARAYTVGASGYIEKGQYLHDLRAVLGNTLLYWSAMKRPAA
ncbi:MAG: response regulator [Herpetosiphonaceae bacterium]|nr:response regulator [Herpetosiphonaceae bacterium]